jgi:16S rRNA A1518/A1519 N6-dimethyltransferase RsmA/KsgA/DIM1 with predicted DNA glycosylase/AP lyase activity
MRTTLSDIERRYVADYDTNAQKALTTPAQEDSFLEKQAQNMLRLTQLKATDAVCEIGIGRGHFIRHALKVTPNVTGVDIAIPYLLAMRGGGGAFWVCRCRVSSF